MLGNEHIEACGKLLHERHDDRGAACAVQVKKRRARAAAAQVSPASVELNEVVREVHSLRFLRVTPDSAMTTGISAKFWGAMTCAPATPGISTSSCSTSMQILRPSSFASHAFPSRAMYSSG